MQLVGVDDPERVSIGARDSPEDGNCSHFARASCRHHPSDGINWVGLMPALCPPPHLIVAGAEIRGNGSFHSPSIILSGCREAVVTRGQEKPAPCGHCPPVKLQHLKHCSATSAPDEFASAGVLHCTTRSESVCVTERRSTVPTPTNRFSVRYSRLLRDRKPVQ